MRDAVALAVVFIVSFKLYRSAPVQQLHDSKYTMLLAQNIIQHHDFDLSRYRLPADDYRLRAYDGHRYYYFPTGAAILSMPGVAAMQMRGLSSVQADGSYNERGELAIDGRIAALLMAVFAALAYATARLLLPMAWSIGITAIASFGTQVLSTASRSVWSDTWGILLVMGGISALLRAAVRREPNNGLLVAVAFASAYVVRPTNAVAMVAVGIYLLVTERRACAIFVVTTVVILGAFVLHSWHLFHAMLPPYFAGNRLNFFGKPWVAIAGNLVSPSRGLLVYVPAVMALALALASYRRCLRFPGIIRLSGFVIAAHLVVLAAFWDWWGGHSYGPRLTTSLVPWFVVLTILAVDGARTSTRSRADWAIGAVAGVLCTLSVAMNVVGAWSFEADRWNIVPRNINDDQARLWSWKRPQFLAPFVSNRGATNKGPEGG